MKAIALAAALFGLAVAAGGCGASSESSTVASFTIRPRPDVPRGKHSDELVVRDIIEGTGAEIKTGDKVSVHYVAGIYETGEEFESAWVPGDPYGFPLGDESVLDGWNEGLPGMRVGGRRMLLIPVTPGVITLGSEPGDTLVYVIDLIKLRERGS